MMARNAGILGLLSREIGPSLRRFRLAQFWPGMAQFHFELVGRLQTRFPGAMRQRALGAAAGPWSSRWPNSGPAGSNTGFRANRANLYKVAQFLAQFCEVVRIGGRPMHGRRDS